MANKQRRKRIARARRHKQLLAQRSADQIGDGVMDGQRREITTRSYQVRAGSLNEENRSVEAVIATEAPVLVMDWSRWEPVEEILLMRGCKLPGSGQVPMLDTHDRSTVQKQLGSTRELHIEGGTLVGRNYYSNSQAAEHSWTLTREGHLKDNSIGYRVVNYVTIEAGKSETVEGRKFTASPTRALRVTTEWEVRENSVCPVGADKMAKNRAAESAGEADDQKVNNENGFSRKDTAMNFNQWLTERGFVEADLSDKQRASLQTQFDAERTAGESTAQSATAATVTAVAAVAKPAARAAVAPAATVTAQPAVAVDVEALRKEGAEAERKRCSDIRTAGTGLEIDSEVVERCIDEDKTIDQAREVFLEAIRTSRPSGVGSPAIIVRGGQMSGDLLTDALLMRAGFDDIIGAEDSSGQRAEAADRMRDTALLEICRYAIQIDGGQVPVGREETIRAAFGTASLPTILGAVYNKSLLKGYNSLEQTYRKWCSIGSAPDFKTITKVRLTSTGDFELLGAGGEIKKGSKTEEKEQYNLETYAKMDRITRQEIINDDLGVLTRLPQIMGRRGIRKINESPYIHLMSNPTMIADDKVLFISAHKNLNTSKALTEGNLQNAITVFRKQKDKEGKSIKARPVFLVVPPELEFTALRLLRSAQVFITGSTDLAQGDANVLQGRLELIVADELSNSNINGYSATSWYVTGSPNEVDTIEVGFLNGKQTPTVITHANIPGVLGIGFDAFIDFACKALDHRGLQKNTA